jgi:hypothetical protein
MFSLSIVEVYDPERDVWEEGQPLTGGRSGHASAVLSSVCDSLWTAWPSNGNGLDQAVKEWTHDSKNVPTINASEPVNQDEQI